MTWSKFTEGRSDGYNRIMVNNIILSLKLGRICIEEKTENSYMKRLHLPYKTAPVNASPAPVVSISSDGGIFSVVPKYNLPHTDPIPSAINFVTGWED